MLSRFCNAALGAARRTGCDVRMAGLVGSRGFAGHAENTNTFIGEVCCLQCAVTTVYFTRVSVSLCSHRLCT